MTEMYVLSMVAQDLGLERGEVSERGKEDPARVSTQQASRYSRLHIP